MKILKFQVVIYFFLSNNFDKILRKQTAEVRRELVEISHTIKDIITNGPKDKKVDWVIISEAYTAEEEESFWTRANVTRVFFCSFHLLIVLCV